MLYKGAYAVDFFAEIVHARTEYGSFHLYGVGVAWQDAVYADWVAVIDAETWEVELPNIIYGMFSACLAVQSYWFLISIACKTAGILQKGIDTLVLLHFVNHRALYLSGDGYEAVVWTNYDDIVVGKTDITRQFAVQDVVVDINNRYQLIVSVYLDVS